MVDFMKSVMFTFESYYVKKVGGLSEVPPRLGEALVNLGVGTEIYTPNHSFIDTCREPVYSKKIDGIEYCISKVDVKPVHYLVGGGILDDPTVYPSSGLLEKALVFARVIYEYFKEDTPLDTVVFHGHDWHSIPVLLSLSKLVLEKEVRSAMLLHVHLGTRNIVEEKMICRYLGVCRDTMIRGGLGVMNFGSYYERAHGIVERIGALIVDKVITVSKGYTKKLSRLLGLEIAGKLDYVFNAAPITWTEVSKIISETFEITDPWDLGTRQEIRRKILTEHLRNIKLSQTEPGMYEVVSKLSDKYDIKYNEPFENDGPLIFLVGRLSRQKGFDYLIRSIERLTVNEPRLRIVIAAVPSAWDIEHLRSWSETMLSYPDNIRFLPGVLGRKDLVSLYYASNLTMIPSRTEPFGLVALESMAAGTPVAVSKTDGLVDIVVDIRINRERGNGVLFIPGDRSDMVDSTLFLLRLIEDTYREIESEYDVRKNCIRRVDEFTWSRSAGKAIEIYREILGLH